MAVHDHAPSRKSYHSTILRAVSFISGLWFQTMIHFASALSFRFCDRLPGIRASHGTRLSPRCRIRPAVTQGRKTSRNQRTQRRTEKRTFGEESSSAGRFFMKFRGPQALPNRPRKTMVCPTKESGQARRPVLLFTGRCRARGWLRLHARRPGCRPRSAYRCDSFQQCRTLL